MKQLSIRLSEDVYQELDYLSTLLKSSKNTVVSNLIRCEYNNFQKDPKISRYLKQAEQVRELLDSFQNTEV